MQLVKRFYQYHLLVIGTTTTTTAGPTTTTTTASPTRQCTAYVVGTRDGAAFFFTFYNCETDTFQTVSINQNNRSWYFCGNPVSAVPPYGYINTIGPCTAPVPTTTTTTTTTAGPTTTSTTTTTTIAPCTTCGSYEIRGALGVNGTWQYTNCLNGATETVGITSQVRRTVASRTAPVKLSGTGTANVVNVYTFPAGYNCGPFDFCKTETWRLVTKGSTPPGFILTQYYNPTNCQQETITLDVQSTTYDISVISGSLTLGGPTSTLNSITLLSTGSSSCCL
jgi:hypothetical protein